MKEIAELLFEDIQIGQLPVFLSRLYPKFDLIKLDFVPELKTTSTITDADSLTKAIGDATDGLCHLRYSKIIIEGQSLDDDGTTIYSYDGKHDIIVFLDKEVINKLFLFNNFYKWVEDLARTLNAKDWMYGLEPANDQNTQFFRKGLIGPLPWSSSEVA